MLTIIVHYRQSARQGIIILSSMDLLNQTHSSLSPQKQPQSPLRATNATSAFKSAGRETGANWANRIIKDFNDLNYEVNISQFRGKEALSNSPNQFRMKKKVGKILDKKDEKEFDKHKFRLELMQMNKVANPERLNLVQQERYSTLDTQGLCKFEFDKTIAGRLKNRGHKHLDFRNQTTRDLVSPSSSPQREYESVGEKRSSLNNTISVFHVNPKNYKVNKCHDFDSYSPRRVFEPREELDKMYDTDHYFRVVKPNRIKETAKLDGLVGRKEPRPKQSSTLAYEEEKSRRLIMRSNRSHEISRSPRAIEFSRQVILSTRGCYR